MKNKADIDRENELKLAQYDARRRRTEKIVIAILFVILVSLLYLEASLFDFRGSFPAPYNLLFFILMNTNIILIFILLFLIFRNIAKLVFERRAKILGSKLRSKLIVAFTAFALLPTVAFFYVAMTFITNSIDRWFSIQVKSSLSESLEVAQSYYQTYEESAVFFAKQIADELARRLEKEMGEEGEPASTAKGNKGQKGASNKGVESSGNLEEKGKNKTVPVLKFPNAMVEDYVEERQADYNVGAVDIYAAPGEKPKFVAGQKLPKQGRETDQKELLAKGWKGKSGSKTFDRKQGEMVWGMAPIIVNNNVAGVVVVRYQIPESLLGRMRSIVTAYEEYNQLQMLEDPLKTSYVIILSLISFFIFFSASWFGFLLSRNMVGPIQKLAEGTRLVAQGDLNVRLEATTRDEFAILVENFNTMTENLAQGRLAIEKGATELRESNVELDRRNAYMETVLANITAGVISFDENGKISTVNSSARNILNVTDPYPIGKSAQEVFGVLFDEKMAKDIKQALERKPTKTVLRQIELEIAGRTRTLMVTLNRIRDDKGDNAGTIVVVEDLTDLVKAQRMAAWQEVARRIAHEIKNPLTPIQLAAQRLRKRYGGRFAEDEQVFLESTSTIIKQVDDLKKMVDEFSSFARMAEPRPAMQNLNDLLGEAVILYSEAHKKIRFNYTPYENKLMLFCDRDQVKRVFINVIDNAVAAIEGKGAIAISSVLNSETHNAEVIIKDNGCGLPAGYRDRLFEPYFSTKKMGTGLGLAIVHQIVTDLDGTIRLENNEPKGTKVTIQFPLSQKPTK